MLVSDQLSEMVLPPCFGLKDVWPDPFIVGSGCLADMQSLRSRVPLFSSDPEDQKVWIPETNGIFWVKSFCRFLNDGGLRICLGINF